MVGTTGVVGAWREPVCAHLSRQQFAGQGLAVRGMLRPMSDELVVEFANPGSDAVSFHVRAAPLCGARGMIVEAECRRVEAWRVPCDGRYDVMVWDGNGLLREFRGVLSRADEPLFEAHLDTADDGSSAIRVQVANFGSEPGRLCLHDRLSHRHGDTRLSPGDVHAWQWDCCPATGRFDYVITSPDLAGFLWRFAGRVTPAQREASAARCRAGAGAG